MLDKQRKNKSGNPITGESFKWAEGTSSEFDTSWTNEGISHSEYASDPKCVVTLKKIVDGHYGPVIIHQDGTTFYTRSMTTLAEVEQAIEVLTEIAEVLKG